MATSLTISATPEDPFRIIMRSLTSGTTQTPGPMSPGNWDETFDYQWLFVDTGATIDPLNPTSFAFDLLAFQGGATPAGTFSVVRGDEIGQSDTDLYIVYAAVPEPGTLALAGIGFPAAGLLVRRRRRALPQRGMPRP